MRLSALTMPTPETHLAQEMIAVARVGEALVFHDPRDTAVATLDDDDVPLAQVAPA
jgi:hypothetical protein